MQAKSGKLVAETRHLQIDAHQHFWRYNADEYGWIDDSMARLRRDFLPADLRPELEGSGFQGCIAVQARQTLEETRWLLELAADATFIAGVVGWVDLQSPDAREQIGSFATNRKLLGFRHVVQSEPDERFLLRPEFLRGMEALSEFDLSYDILIYPMHLAVATEFVRRFPRQRFVLDHLAKPPIKNGDRGEWERGIRELARIPNVWCKLSGLVTEGDWQGWKAEHLTPYLDVAFDCFGAERLMIGSDWPVCTVAATYERVMDIVQEYLARIAASGVHQAVLGGNARRFWRLRDDARA